MGQVSNTPYNNYTSTSATRGRAPWARYIGFGSIAIAVGVVCAMVYIHGNHDPEPVAPPAPVVMPALAAPPLVTPAPFAKPEQVELRFDSLPSAGIYAEGHSAELCRTPCAFNIELTSESEAKSKRTFIVRSEGYLDKQIVVDLGGAQHEFHVTLDHDMVPMVPIEGGSIVEPIKKQTKAQTKLKRNPKTDKPAETLKPVVEDPPPVPEVRKPTGPAPASTIDPTDTHDPFKSHK